METTQEAKEDALSFLSSNVVATLATISPTNKPHAATIYFHVEPDFSLYFIIKSKTGKHENILHEPHVAMVITDATAVTTIQAEGRVELITNQEKIAKIRAKITEATKKNTPWSPPIDQIKDGEYIACKVVPTWLRYADFRKRKDPTNEQFQHFHQIIP